MGRTIRTVRVMTLALALLAGVSVFVRAGEPPKTQPGNPAQSLQAEDAAALRVSPAVKPPFKIVSAASAHNAMAWVGPDLVPLPPRIGTYVAGMVQVSGQAVPAWELFWRVKNQGGKDAASGTVVRSSCTPMNVNPALPPQTKLWLSALLCQWLNTYDYVSSPIPAGQVTETRSFITYPANVPCSATHSRVTVSVDYTNKVNEGPREDNNEMTLDFCQ